MVKQIRDLLYRERRRGMYIILVYDIVMDSEGKRVLPNVLKYARNT